MLSQDTIRRKSLLFLFDAIAGQARPTLIAHYGQEETTVILKETRQEFAALVLQLPDIGGWRNPHVQFIFAAACFLALYRALKTHNQSVDEVGALIYEATEKMYSSRLGVTICLLNRIQRRLLGYRVEHRIASLSQRRRYPDDFVCSFVEGDGESFDYGLDYSECGICKFFHTQNADEFTPYMCQLDYPYAQALGCKLIRTTTIAAGGAKCDFRFKALKGQP